MSDIQFADLLKEIKFDTTHPGGRQTKYFGDIPYKYGRYSHAPEQYPTSEIFDKIFDKLGQIDADITKDNYTCLCTLYKDGHASIPLHQDDERSIVHDSSIYTVSFGVPRVLKLSNTVGPPAEHEVPLAHGTVIGMSRESQNSWRHGIDADPTVSGPRISLTLRKLQVPAPPPRDDVPPVAPPQRDQLRSTTQVRNSRVLFIHDSIHRDTPESMLEQVPGHTCVKHLNYQLY